MSIVYTGKIAPLDGKRKLSADEALLRDKAMHCVRSKAMACQGQVYVGLFFDGTGNNDQWVEKGRSQTQRVRNKHSNVARLFDAHLNEPESGFFAYYMPGVGTPFKDVGDTSEWAYDNLGMGLGYMGADRINYGITSILNAVHIYLTKARLLDPDAQRALVNAISVDALNGLPVQSTARWSALTAVEERLATVVEAHERKVIQINVSLFGFSRGAAEARACAYWLSQICERKGDGVKLAGVPLRIGFMGLFDTVAAVGLGDVTPFTHGHMAWADGTQAIHPLVEDCAHFVALHEQRASFPLEVAVGRGNIGYPGMHSDVGGGYWPGEQGKAMADWGVSPHLSQIPLLDMHFTALKAGAAMMTIEEIAALPRTSKSFATDPTLVAAYNSWLANHGVKSGTAQDVTAAHASQYIRWRGTLIASGGVGRQAFYQRAVDVQDQTDLSEADKSLGLQLRFLKERLRANSTTFGFLRERAQDVLRITTPTMLFLVDPGKSPLTSQEKKFLDIAEGPPPPDAIGALFADYAHDSRAGFRPWGMQEPIWMTGGYLRFRKIFTENIHSESSVYGLANQSVSSAITVGKAFSEFLDSIWRSTTLTYARTREMIENAPRRAAAAAYQAAESAVWRRCQQAEKELLRQLDQRYPR